jgi:thymidine kinase
MYTQQQPGRIEAICGPMFSGKSEELIRRLKRAMIAKKRVACFKPRLDSRYHSSAIASHSQQILEAIPVVNIDGIRAHLEASEACDVIGIDEAQFFEPRIVGFVNNLVADGMRVIVAGLDTTFEGVPFVPMPDLMAIADEVLKLTAVCIRCGAPAIHTQRLSGGTSRVVVGAAGLYEAHCRACFEPDLAMRVAAGVQLEIGTPDGAAAV